MPGRLTPKKVTVLASAARTATPTVADIPVPAGYRHLLVFVDATAVTATPAVTTTISGVDEDAVEVFTLLASAAVATVTHNVYRVSPEMLAETNLTAQAFLPPVIRIAPAHGDADSITYSVVAWLLP